MNTTQSCLQLLQCSIPLPQMTPLTYYLKSKRVYRDDKIGFDRNLWPLSRDSNEIDVQVIDSQKYVVSVSITFPDLAGHTVYYIEFLRSPLYIAIIYSYFTLSQEKTSVTSLNDFPRIFQLGTCSYIFKTEMANCIDVSNTKSKRDNSFPLVFRLVGGIDRVFVYVMLSFKHRSIPNHIPIWQ